MSRLAFIINGVRTNCWLKKRCQLKSRTRSPNAVTRSNNRARCPSRKSSRAAPTAKNSLAQPTRGRAEMFPGGEAKPQPDVKKGLDARLHQQILNVRKFFQCRINAHF